MGPGGLGRRPGQHLLRLVPRGVRPRPLRGMDGPDGRRRSRDGARRDAVPVRAPAAAGRLDAAQQPGQRQDRARLVRHPARRDRLSDPDGRPARPDRRRRSTRTTSSPPRTSWSPTAPRSASERWEEQDGYSPSTIAAEIAGLVAAADLADANHDTASARRLARRRRRLPALDQGLDGHDQRPTRRRRYFIRLSKTGDPNAAITYNVGNGGPTLDQRTVIDAGFLELVAARRAARERPGHSRSRCPSSTRRSRRDTASGPGWHRYNGDGYGDGAATAGRGRRAGKGTGHLWPALSAERAEQSLQTGDAAGAASLLDGDGPASPSGVGLIPEQDWELPDLAGLAVRHRPDDRLDRLRERRARRARPSPLTWSAGVVRAPRSRDLAAGRTGRPAREHLRALRRAHAGADDAHGHEPGRPDSPVTGSPVTVTRHDGAGQHGLRRGHQHRRELRDDDASTTAARRRLVQRRRCRSRAARACSTSSPSARPAATAHATRTVVFDFVPGTRAARRHRPDHDDNGPGNYAYPTSDNFQPGAFDIQEFQVFDDGTNVIFRVQDARPDADVRQPARRAARRRVRPRSRRAGDDLDGRRQPAAQLPDRAGRSPGAG